MTSAPALRRVAAWLAARSPATIAALAGPLVLGIGYVDHVTGYELALSVFYLAPVALCAWYAGPHLGRAACVAAAAVWLLVDWTSGHDYENPAIPYWNAAVRLGFFVVVAHLLVRLRAALAASQRQAQRDDLTGLLNGRALRERYRLVAGLAHRSGQQLALAYLDVDGFKTVNDTLGHEVGDEVLRAVAATLTARLRTTDAVGRLGGDEFAVVVFHVDERAAGALFEQLLGSLRELAAARAWPIGFSIGVGVFPTPCDEHAAFTFADRLMYGAKRAGGDRVDVATFPGERAGRPRDRRRSAAS